VYNDFEKSPYHSLELMIVLAHAMGSLGALTTLGLSGNQISDPGMMAFSNAIRNGSLRALEVLDLGHNLYLIGDLGMIEFSRSIANGSLAKLTRLFLFGNQIGDVARWQRPLLMAAPCPAFFQVRTRPPS
jgi:hypothetical protein